MKFKIGILNFKRCKYDTINNLYVKNFHNIAKCMAKNTSFDEFINRMDQYFINDVNYKKLPNKNEDLEKSYKFYN